MEEVERLVEYFVPERYGLKLFIDKSKKRAEGIVRISGEAKKNLIKFHASGLEIETVLLGAKELEYEDEDDILTVGGMNEGLVEDLEIHYSLELNEQMQGIYLSSYEYEGKTETIVATQFESHYARQAFPCIDEPEAKAVFDVSIAVPDDDVVIGNMPVATEGASADFEGREVKFEPTPVMSTYLLAFVIGKFNKVSTVSKKGVEVNAYASLAQSVESLEFAAKVGADTLDFFDNYFGVPYPLPKCDQVALPDFESGAMENWGLVTYRESCMLVDPKATSVAVKKHVLLVITHELSHQWFGNLVTMKWWDDLWLNESFASVMEYVAADALFPDWEMWNDFFANDAVAAIRRDALSGVQAVKQAVRHPDEIATLFDGAIVYAKGAHLMYMLMELMGEERFLKGLREYFKKYAYSNAEGDNLWDCLGAFADFDVKKFMKSWVDKPGYPVVVASVEGDRLNLAQKRFLLDGDVDTDEVWPVPLFMGIEGEKGILSERSDSLVLDGADRRVELNSGFAGHYIVKYDGEMKRRILGAESGSVDKLKMLLETIMLARTKLGKTADLIDVIEVVGDVKSSVVWDMVGLAVADIKMLIESGTEEEKALKGFVANLARKQYERLGWQRKDDESVGDTELRAQVISLMIFADDEAVVSEAIRRFDSGDLESLDGDLRDDIISAKVKNDLSSGLVDELLNKYEKTYSADLRDDICGGLCATRSEKIIERLLGAIKNSKIVRAQDAPYWFVYLIRNRVGTGLAMSWLESNWEWVVKSLGDKTYTDFPRYVASAMRTSEQLDWYREFFGPMADKIELKRAIEVGIKEVEARIRLIESDAAEVRERLLTL